VVPDPVLGVPPGAGHGQRPRSTGRRALAVAAGVGAAVVTAWLVAGGVLRGPAALAVLLLVTLVVPTSRELARRVLIAGCLILGWVPLLWWWRLPVGEVGHVGLLLAGTVGALVGWCLWDDAASRSRALLPRIRWTDGVVAGAAVVSAWFYAPGLGTSSAEAALSRLMAGWDNVAHYDMTEMIRRFGVMVVNAPRGSNGVWAYAAYPQGYHAVAATVMEALIGPRVVDPAIEVAAYSHALSIVALGSVVMVVAGLCSLPSLRRRPLLALPLAALVVATFALGPGGMVLANGFPNFFVALAVLCCIPLLAVQLTRLASVPLLGALGGAAVAVAHNWSLLLAMGAFGAIAVLFPVRRSRWPRSVAGWARVGTVALATLAGLAMAGSILVHTGPLGTLLTTSGGVSRVSIKQVALATALALAACIYIGVRGRADRATPHAHDAVRTAWLGLLVGAGLVTTAAIAALESRSGAEPGAYYYFWKDAIALQILSVVVVVCAVPIVVPRRRQARDAAWRGAGSPIWAGVGSVVVAVALFQVYGTLHVFPGPLGGRLAPGIAGRGQDKIAMLAPAPDAAMLLAAARATSGDAPCVFAADSPSGKDRMLVALWFMSLSGRWDAGNDQLMRDFPAPAPADAAAVARTVADAVEATPDVRVVVDPGLVDQVRGLVSPGVGADRIVTW
jgi:hypothetical protein